MKILVTGATGFIGRHVCSEIAGNGHSVRAFVRRTSVDKIDPASGYEVVTGDILDTHACLRAATGVDAVVHLVGIRQENPETGTTYEAMHTEATYNIVNAAQRQRVPRFVYMSGLGTRENAKSRYHITKWESEQIVRRSNMRWTIFRPSVVFGDGDEFHPLLADLVERPVVPIVDGGKSLLQPISVQNVVTAVAESLTMPETAGEVYEAGGPDRVEFYDLVQRAARACDVWPNFWKVSSLLMKPMVRMMQRVPNFPLTYDELLLMLEDNVCDSEHFTATFDVKLDAYLENFEALMGNAARARVA